MSSLDNDDYFLKVLAVIAITCLFLMLFASIAFGELIPGKLLEPNYDNLSASEVLKLRSLQDDGYALLFVYLPVYPDGALQIAPVNPESPVPEPVTFLLVGSGLVGLTFLRRK